jgi:hypothetical protein
MTVLRDALRQGRLQGAGFVLERVDEVGDRYALRGREGQADVAGGDDHGERVGAGFVLEVTGFALDCGEGG